MKIIAIASVGGHWVQLLRLLPVFDGMELIFVSTQDSLASTVFGHKFYCIPDGNRWDKLRLIRIFYKVFRIVFIERPDVIISTGAAPGLMGLAAGKILGIKTIWIESIACAEKLSLSGRIAAKFVDRIYTQWPHLANGRVIYAGNILL